MSESQSYDSLPITVLEYLTFHFSKKVLKIVMTLKQVLWDVTRFESERDQDGTSFNCLTSFQ